MKIWVEIGDLLRHPYITQSELERYGKIVKGVYTICRQVRCNTLLEQRRKAQDKKKHHKDILNTFATKLADNQQDIDPEISKMVNENFMDLIGDSKENIVDKGTGKMENTEGKKSEPLTEWEEQVLQKLGGIYFGDTVDNKLHSLLHEIKIMIHDGMQALLNSDMSSEAIKKEYDKRGLPHTGAVLAYTHENKRNTKQLRAIANEVVEETSKDLYDEFSKKRIVMDAFDDFFVRLGLVKNQILIVSEEKYTRDIVKTLRREIAALAQTRKIVLDQIRHPDKYELDYLDKKHGKSGLSLKGVASQTALKIIKKHAGCVYNSPTDRIKLKSCRECDVHNSTYNNAGEIICKSTRKYCSDKKENVKVTSSFNLDTPILVRQLNSAGDVIREINGCVHDGVGRIKYCHQCQIHEIDVHPGPLCDKIRVHEKNKSGGLK